MLLEDQERSRWDAQEIAEGLVLVERALRSGRPGPYALQAAIAAVHARAGRPAHTDWRQIVALYDALYRLHPTPVVALNQAVAVAMADGPLEGLTRVDALAAGVTAWRFLQGTASALGDPSEGLLWLPATAEFLRDRLAPRRP